MGDQVGGPDGRVAVSSGELVERQVGKSLEAILEKTNIFSFVPSAIGEK